MKILNKDVQKAVRKQSAKRKSTTASRKAHHARKALQHFKHLLRNAATDKQKKTLQAEVTKASAEGIRQQKAAQQSPEGSPLEHDGFQS